jgi:hypothetical protein
MDIQNSLALYWLQKLYNDITFEQVMGLLACGWSAFHFVIFCIFQFTTQYIRVIYIYRDIHTKK